jgi:hypothetical protein
VAIAFERLGIYLVDWAAHRRRESPAVSALPGFYATPGAAIPGMFWPGKPIPAIGEPVFTYPALWSVEWAQAETQVTVTNLAAATITITPAGPLAATIAVTDAAGDDAGTLGPADVEVIYPSPPAVIQPSE